MILIFQNISKLRISDSVDFISYLKHIKTLHSVPGRSVICDCDFTQNIFLHFLDIHLKPIKTKVKSYIKDANDFLRKLQNLSKLLER